MKRILISMGIIVAATMSLTNCKKEIAAPEAGNGSFAIYAEADTKTNNDGMSTKWVADDALTVFHALAGATEYGSNDKFTISEAGLASNKFTGSLTEALEEGMSYDWYALYPYNSQIVTPANTSRGYITIGSASNGKQTQNGNDSKAHLSGENLPLYAQALDFESDVPPTFVMKQLAAVIAVKVKNSITDPLAVATVSFKATEPVVGTYYVDFAGVAPVYTSSGDNYVSSTANLNVTDAADLANGESATYYLAIKPFKASSGEKLTLTVNGYSKEITLTADADFKAGHIKTLNFDFNQKPAELVTFDLSIDETTTATETEISWVNDVVTIKDEKAGATTSTNNYYPGTSGKTYTSTRFYKNSVLTVTPADGYSIEKVVFAATSKDYASAFASSTWSNASASAEETTVTVTPDEGTNSFSATIGATCGFTSIIVYYSTAAPAVKYAVNIADGITNGTVSTDVATAKAGQTVTVTATPASGYELENISVQTISGDPVAVADSKFTMPAADVNVSATFTKTQGDLYSINLNNSLYGVGSGSNAAEQSVTTSDGITVISGCLSTASNKTYYAAGHIRYYTDSYLKLAAPDGYEIVKVVFTPDGSWNGGITANVGNYTDTDKTWVGSSDMVDFSFSNQCRVSKIDVTLEQSSVTKYTVNCQTVSGGTISASPVKAAEGAVVTLTATPDTGYAFESWSVTGAAVADATSATTTFTMPAANVNVSATFKAVAISDKTIAEFIAAKGGDCYLTGVVSNIVNTTYGNFDLTDASGKIYVYGCLTPDQEAQKFSTLGVEFGDKIKVLASEYELYNGTDEAKNVVFVEILEKAAKYNVNIASGIANGTVSVSPTQAAAGQTVTITATPASGYKVKSVSAKKTASGTAISVSDDYEFTMPAEAVTVSAEFELNAGGETTVTWVAKDDAANPGNIQDWLSGTIDSNISWSASKGGSNNPKYYDTGTGLRVYNGGTFKIEAANEKKITKVVLTFSAANYTFSTDMSTPHTETLSSVSSKEWSVSRTCRLQKVEVTYK